MIHGSNLCFRKCTRQYIFLELPASIALRAASLKSLTTKGISSVLRGRGGDQSTPSKPGVTPLLVHEIGASPFG